MDYDELRQAITDNSGVLTIDMGTLRDAHKAGKLGIHVRANISRELRSRGIGHMPEELPAYQHERVRLWLMGTPAGDLIESVLKIGSDSDATIREAAESDATDVLERVRELVCA